MLKIYLKRFLKNKSALFGGVIILLIATLGIVAPFVVKYSPEEQNITKRLTPPSREFLLGTDDLGRDLFSRMVYSIRISFSVGIIAVFLSVIVGTSLGILSGYFGRWVDQLIMRFVDIMLCFPTFFLILLVIAFLEPNIFTIMAVIGLTSWMGLARMVRAEVLSLKEREFVLAARLLGLSYPRIFFVHILPNVISPIIVYATIGVGSAILVESGLSFLGLGVQPPTPSWGQIISGGKDYIHIAWWLTFFPGMAILITVLSFNLLGEGLRDILDPKHHG